MTMLRTAGEFKLKPRVDNQRVNEPRGSEPNLSLLVRAGASASRFVEW